MTSCKEFYLDDVMAITAIPIEDYNPGVAAWQLRPTVPEDEFYPALENAVVIGQQPAVAGGALVPIRKFTGKAKDEEADSVAGRLHTATVTCQVDDREGEAWGHLLTLERTPSHLLLTFRDGARGFAQASIDTYLCTVGRDGAKTSVDFRIQNLMGIQLLVAE